MDKLRSLARTLAPDVLDDVTARATPVPPAVFARLAPIPPQTGVIALARRPAVVAADLWQNHRTAPLILLERPTHLGNMGAVVRVAAGAGAAGVLTVGPHDPWAPEAIRGGAGLQYALPVVSSEQLATDAPGLPLAARSGPLLAVHPAGETIGPETVPANAILAFGSERRGLSDELLAAADGRIAIPMQPGVSSLNLATSVAVVLYTWRLQAGCSA